LSDKSPDDGLFGRKTKQAFGPDIASQGKNKLMIRNTNSKSAFLILAKVLLLWVPLVLASPSKAWGYVDPGTGSLVYQAAYAMLLGGTYYLRRMLDRVWRKRK
jgi:hypothetical protein